MRRPRRKPERWDYTGLGDYLRYRWSAWALSAWGVLWCFSWMAVFHSSLSVGMIWFLTIMGLLNILTFLGVCRTYYKTVLPHMAWREEIKAEWAQRAEHYEEKAELLQWSDSVTTDRLRSLAKLARQLSRLEHLND